MEKEQKSIMINQVLLGGEDGMYSGYRMVKGFEYVLFNDRDEVVFKGELVDYKYDEKLSLDARRNL